MNENGTIIGKKGSKALYLHSAAVLTPSGAILFLGHHSSGKSTLCEMLGGHYRIIADDKVVAQKKSDGRWYVREKTGGHGEPPSDHPGHNIRAVSENGGDSYPLLSIARVFASQVSSVESMVPSKTCEYLMDAVFEIAEQRNVEHPELLCQLFRDVADIARNHQGWKMQFELDKEVVLSYTNMILTNELGSNGLHKGGRREKSQD